MKIIKSLFWFLLFLATLLTGFNAGYGSFLYFAGVFVASVIFGLKFELRGKDPKPRCFTLKISSKQTVFDSVKQALQIESEPTEEDLEKPLFNAYDVHKILVKVIEKSMADSGAIKED